MALLDTLLARSRQSKEEIILNDHINNVEHGIGFMTRLREDGMGIYEQEFQKNLRDYLSYLIEQKETISTKISSDKLRYFDKLLKVYEDHYRITFFNN